MFFRLLFGIYLLEVATSLPHPGVHIGKDGTVGASFGGYSASAGLGGILGGAGPRGGLHAQAGTPDGHFAAAGLGGSVSEGAGPQGHIYSGAGHVNPVVYQTPVAQPVAPVATVPVAAGGANSQASASASASAGSGGFQGGAPVVVNRRPGSFFDDIFNIPISTLGAVNQYLNNRHKVVAVPSGVVQTQPDQSSHSNSFASASASASSSAGSSSAGSSSSANSDASSGTPVAVDNNIYHGYQKNYNDIFNIPISVLGAVNRFLNGK